MKRFAFVLALLLTAGRASASGRTILSLDGQWQVAQGTMEAMPPRFDRTAPVPGLCDMASPPFTEVGVASEQRQAFWYRRTFRIRGPKRGIALLKVTKAQFGTNVWLNGSPAGEHLGCFTPGWFDLSKLIRYDQPNTLVIRVGAYRDVLPPSVPTNTDYEQTKWLPGIYDSVSLHLVDGPYVESVQVAPHLADGSALVQVTVRNPRSAAATVPLHLGVREWKSRKPAASGEAKITIGAGESATVTQSLKLTKPRLWSPEDPFLYIVRCDTGGDSLEARFGMREFRFDAATGQAMLNGRPYFLRGTNFCMFRFFEDPVRAALPWDHDWARKLLALGRTQMGWNSARVCIAPFPEFWYDIADEQGWLLQDEFPIWGFHDAWSQEELTTEFREWMRERWNHPSIAIWDACNETKTPRSGQLIAAVRDLDLSDRPWDDGYSTRHRPSDSMEDHPYRFSDPKFKLESLGHARGAKGGLLGPPVLINEYGWLWLNRDGTPTTLTEKAYANNLGAEATPEQRRAFYAYNLAALTEYWRARRQAAGVLHFCYLTYSRPGGQTSDHFLDVTALELEPHFAAYMRDAFAPVGVMIDDFASKLPGGGRREYALIVTNDLYSVQSGSIRLRLLDAESGALAASSQALFTVESLGQAFVALSIKLPTRAGRYRLEAELAPTAGRHVISRRELNIVSPAEAKRFVNIARGCLATASSEIDDTRGDCRACFATDGESGTRWSSQFADPQWLCVDLGRERRIARVELQWETAFGKAYRVEVSADGQTWREVARKSDGQGGTEELSFAPVDARYVRLACEARGTEYGYSLYEFRVYEQ